MAQSDENGVPLLRRRTTWTSRSRAGRARWYFMMPAQMLQTLSLAMVIPLLPRMKLQFFHGDGRLTTRVQSTAEVVRALLVMVVNQALGSMSDVIGRKSVLCIGLICNALPLLCLELSSNLWIYFTVFALVGALGGQATLFNAYIADCSREEDRSRRFSLAGAASGIGMALGAFGGGMLEQATSRQAVLATAACTGVLAVAAVLPVPESLPADVQQKDRPAVSLSSLWRPLQEFAALADTRMWLFVLMQFMRGCVMEGYMTASLFAIAQLLPDWTDQDNGYLFILMGGSTIVAQGLILPFLTAWGCHDKFLALSAQLAITVGSAATGFFLFLGSKPGFFVSMAITTSFSFVDPVFTKLITTGMPEHLGLILGVFQSLQAFTAVFAPFLFTAAFAVAPICVFVMIFIFNVLAFLSLVFAFCVGQSKIREENVGDPDVGNSFLS